MEPIFDLSNVKKLVDDNKPRALLLVDTNIVMNNPDMTRWETDLKEPIYIFPQVILSELEFLNKKKDNVTAEKSREVTRKFAEFASTGNINKGVYTNNVGWIISVMEPASSLINSALDEYEIIKKAWGESDAKTILLLLAVSEFFKNFQVILLTNDKSLSNLANVRGFLTHEVPEFPLQLDTWLANKELQQFDLKKSLADITQLAKENLWTVEATMISKRYDSEHIEIDGMLSKIANSVPPEMLVDEPNSTSAETADHHEIYHQISDLRKYRNFGDSNEEELHYPSWYQYKENKRDIENGIRKGFIIVEGDGKIIRPQKHDIGFTWKTYYKPLISPVMASGAITEFEDVIGRRHPEDMVNCYTIINLLGTKQSVSDMLIPLLGNEICNHFKAVIFFPGSNPMLRTCSAESPLSIAEWGSRLPDKYWLNARLEPDALIEHLINYINSSAGDEVRDLLSSILLTWDVGQKVRFRIEKAIHWQDGTIEDLIND